MTQSRSLLSKFDTTRAIFVDGIDARTGTVFRQPRLAESYRQFAAEGAAALYGGSIGDEIVRYCAEQGGLITRDDLLRQAPRWNAPHLDPLPRRGRHDDASSLNGTADPADTQPDGGR